MVNIKELAVSTISKEAQAIEHLKSYIDGDFETCVHRIFASKGRLIVSGIGKSANIAAKIVSTLNSTGTPAVFMHAADAIHGDLGIIQPDDIVMCISKSGNTPEIKVLVPLIKNFGNLLIGMVGNMDSVLAQQADLCINCFVEEEACPNNLAPTNSSTAQLVMGDTLAVCLLACRGFTPADFAKYHPGGALGKQLYLHVSDLLMLHEKPQVEPNARIQDVIIEISSKRLGATAVTENEHILGIITDGDLRRMMQKQTSFAGMKASDIMSGNPRTVKSDELAVNALVLMRQYHITQLLVVDSQDRYVGVIHLHDLLKEGII